jgi:hypothetical protein
MRKPLIISCFVLLVARFVAGADENPKASFDAKRLNRELPATWECVSFVDQPKQISHIKHVTPTHFTWVTYDRDQHAVESVAGGTWSIKDGKYEEVCEFASNSHPHLRGKSNDFTINLVGDKWDNRSVPGNEVEIDEVWTRMKQGEQQKKNTGEPGRQLLGTWEIALGPDAPKAARMLKHITPTHWTWTIHDRENKMVFAAMGGSWSLHNGEYVEDVEFATDNYEKSRGTSHSYGFRIDGDRWILKGGFNVAFRHDEIWTRLKRPNP